LKGEYPVPTFLFAYRLSRDNHLILPDWLLLVAIFSEGVDSFFESEVKSLLKNTFRISIHGTIREAYKNTPLPKIANLIKAGFSSVEKDNYTLQLIEKIISNEIQSHA
jgi:hypothetical protein